VLYLNELSCACEGLAREEIASHLENMIDAVRKVTLLRGDAIMKMHCKLRELTLGNECLSLGSVLPGTNGRLSRLKRMLDRAPCGPVLSCMREVRFNGQNAIGLSWADLSDSFVVSVGCHPHWSAEAISCERCLMDDSANISIMSIEVRNLSRVSHVDFWRQSIHGYGKEIASSSILYEGTRFTMRMHFHDHPPAHVHIYARRGDTHELIARVRVDNCDIMSGSLSSAMNEEIMNLIRRERVGLLESWANVQAGRLPLIIQ